MSEAILDLEFIAPPKRVVAQFSLEPVRSILSSLCLLNEDLSGLGEWVYQTAQNLSPQDLETNLRVCGAAPEYVERGDWSSFPAWLDELSGRDPMVLRDRTLTKIRAKAREHLAEDEPLPTVQQLLEGRELYLSTIERLYECKGHAFNRQQHEQEHRLLNDPAAWQDMIVSHLRLMWDQYLAAEWERNLPALQESVAAYTDQDFSGMAAGEILSQVTGREELPEDWQAWIPQVERLIFIPSMHIGPYLLLIDQDETTTRIVFGARAPEGTKGASRSLSRTELLMRLSALADDTRLRIVELLISEGELSAKELMARLKLSQSSASRHLRQLSATGYLVERREEIGKLYRLNRERLYGTLEDIKRSLQ